MRPVAPSNPTTPSKSLVAYTWLGNAEMVYLEDRTCSLCGATVNNFRIAHPIMRYDPARPYYHRVGSDRGWKDSRQIGWSCGKHRTISPDWLPKANLKEGLDMVSIPRYSPIVALEARQEIREIRDKLNLSREKFARLIGYSQAAVIKWENGERRVQERALLLARHLLMTNEETAA